VQESSGSVGARFSETWVGCGKERCSSQASSEKMEMAMVEAVFLSRYGRIQQS